METLAELKVIRQAAIWEVDSLVEQINSRVARMNELSKGIIELSKQIEQRERNDD